MVARRRRKYVSEHSVHSTSFADAHTASGTLSIIRFGSKLSGASKGTTVSVCAGRVAAQEISRPFGGCALIALRQADQEGGGPS